MSNFSTKVEGQPIDLSAVTLMQPGQTRKSETKFYPKDSLVE